LAHQRARRSPAHEGRHRIVEKAPNIDAHCIVEKAPNIDAHCIVVEG